MSFEELTAAEFAPVLRETRRIWSAGLANDQYLEFNDMQRTDVWGRRHQEIWGYKTEDGDVAAALKLYKLKIKSRHIEYPCYGVGAIYSIDKFRGQGYGGKIVRAATQKAHQDKQTALLLFSDIGHAFYAQYGFYPAGSIEISVHVNKSALDTKKLKATRYKRMPLYRAPLEEMERYHRRWLARRPFGISRSLDYFKYKVRKEDFLNRHSNLPWPMLHVIMVEGKEASDMAYAIYEVGGDSMRLLELVSSRTLLPKIWRAIFLEAATQHLTRIKTWESNLLDLAPGYSLRTFLKANVFVRGFRPTIFYTQRGWGQPMILPLEKEARPWTMCFPSPILELDHL